MRPIIELTATACEDAEHAVSVLRYLLEYERDGLYQVVQALPKYKREFDKECLRSIARCLESKLNVLNDIERFLLGLEYCRPDDVCLKYAIGEDGELLHPELFAK